MGGRFGKIGLFAHTPSFFDREFAPIAPRCVRVAWDNTALNLAYPAAFFLYCLMRLLAEIELDRDTLVFVSGLENIAQLGALLLLFTKLAVQRYSGKSMLLLIAAGAVVVVSGLHAGSFTLLWTFLFVAASQGEQLGSMLKASLLVFAVGTATIVVLSVAGILPNEIAPDIRAVRYALGFKHPNMLAKNITAVAVSLLMLRFDSLGTKIIFTAALLVVFGYAVTASRTAAAIGVTAIVLVVLCRNLEGHLGAHRVARGLACGRVAVFLLVALFSLVAMAFFDQSNTLLAWSDNLLSGRLGLAHEFYLEFPPTLWGRGQASMVIVGLLPGVPQTPFLVDNAYAHLLLSFGYVAAALFILVYVTALWNGGRGRMTPIVAGLVICAIMGVGESCILDASFNCYFVIACSNLLYGKSTHILDCPESGVENDA